MGQPEGWLLLKDGAAKVAGQRLAATHKAITDAVVDFHDAALTHIADMHGESQSGLGLSLFKALTDVLMVAFPEEMIIQKVAGEAIKAFRDEMISGIESHEKDAEAESLANAQSQLRHALDDLAAAFRASAKQGWSAGHYKIDDSLTKFFESNPSYKNIEFGQDADWYENWICDQIGILESDPDAQITAALWAKFNHEVARVSWRQKMEHTPALERSSLEYAQWAHLEPHERAQALADLDEHARQALLSGAPVLDDEKAAWLQIASFWNDATTRPIAEMELLVLTGQ